MTPRRIPNGIMAGSARSEEIIRNKAKGVDDKNERWNISWYT